MIMVKLNEITVELTEQMLMTVKKYIQGKGQSENGGILLGGYIPAENKYIITTASEPCNKDCRGMVYFIRNRENAQEIINNYWKASEGKINYLGEWHTHGCKNPYPSYTDKKLLKSLIKDKSNVWAELFMLIVGRNNTFYLGMTNEKSKGKIIAEIQIEGDKDAFIFNR